jgi:hypothetical protein
LENWPSGLALVEHSAPLIKLENDIAGQTRRSGGDAKKEITDWRGDGGSGRREESKGERAR